jgi:ATP-binding cassette subfamily F protein uup
VVAILINAHQLSLSFGSRPLFEGVSFSVDSGERVGLIGPNGAGKSSLLKILAGRQAPDSGTLSVQKGLKIGFLEQVPQFKAGITVMEAALEGVYDPYDWEEIAPVQELLSRLDLADRSEDLVESLSGGWKKRVALARELARKPELLLLDEPTNHLDIESILWLEEFLGKAPFATVTITHDRAFLQRVSNRILELDRKNPGGLLSVKGDYLRYLQTREELMNAQLLQEDKLRNTLRRETEWLRRGAKARTTKQQARIDRHAVLSDNVAELAYRNKTGTARIDFQGVEKNPKKLVEAIGISKSYNGKVIVPKMDLLISPKTRLGLLGANGSGKSTLIRMLLGEEQPDTGSVFRTEHLQPIYFEQNRESLDPELSLAKTLCPRGDHVEYCGSMVHINGYIDRFLFTPAQREMAVGKLSGGEQSRLLIAKLMLRNSNLLFLDEPTNDLDVATLEVLREVLQDFPGAVVLVTHDRFFLDQVANQILAFAEEEGKKKVIPFADVVQWEEWHTGKDEREAAFKKAKNNAPSPAKAAAKTKLSFKEQRELDGMEATIQNAEAKLAALEAESNKPEVLSHASRLVEITNEMGQVQKEIERLYARWSELNG